MTENGRRRASKGGDLGSSMAAVLRRETAAIEGGRASSRFCDPMGGDGERRRRWTATSGTAEDAATDDCLGLTATMKLRWFAAAEKGWTVFGLALRCRRRPRGEPATTATVRRIGWRSNRGGELGLHGDSGFRRDLAEGNRWPG
uniref:Uncharacterized protein n=1 Tax=Oryza sativa subsp. japonica TaxID=39947 RepID=Q6ZG71_ORYSJ|nr:hypothetical protein [Oryza sativa Japonica Group]